MPGVLAERLLFYRERSAKAYGAVSYWISILVVTTPQIIINAFAYSIIVYYLAGLRDTHPKYFIIYYFNVVLCSYAGAFTCRTIAAACPTDQAAINLFPVAMMSLMAFGGFGLLIPEMHLWLRAWGPYISFIRWGYQGLVLNEFQDNSYLPLEKIYLEQLGFDNYTSEICLSILPIFICSLACMTLLALKYCIYEER